MLNQAVLVGRIHSITKDILKNNNITIVLKIPRSYKDKQGAFIEDYITILLENNTAKSAIDYCKVGDLIGVKGTIQCEDAFNYPIVFAEKITFLSAKKGGEE